MFMIKYVGEKDMLNHKSIIDNQMYMSGVCYLKVITDVIHQHHFSPFATSVKS